MVQEINGSLHDFSNPKYNHKKWDALDNAINKGDTLIMTPDQAKWFTENYKNFYPKFRNGGVGSFKSQLYAATETPPPREMRAKRVRRERERRESGLQREGRRSFDITVLSSSFLHLFSQKRLFPYF